VQHNDPVCVAKWSDEQHETIILAYFTPQSDGHKQGETETHACVCHDIHSGGGDKKDQ
jgi:hypothetical protein